MKNYQEYFDSMARCFLDDYLMDCTSIAEEIAKRLKKEGKKPELIRYGEDKDSSKANPLKYPGKKWKYHDVCYSDGLVHDPMIGFPVPLKQYSLKAFGKIIVPTKLKLEEILSKQKNKKNDKN